MTDEEIVAELAEVLDNLATGLWMGPGWGRIVAAALLPTVRHIAEQRAAAELVRAAADVRQNHGTASGTAQRIRTRAAALEEKCVCDTGASCLADRHDKGRCDACEAPGLYAICCRPHEAHMCPACVERCHPTRARAAALTATPEHGRSAT